MYIYILSLMEEKKEKKAWVLLSAKSQVGNFSKFFWAILRRLFFTVTLGINCQSILVNLDMSPNSSRRDIDIG